jgi:hypothetical protein
MYSIRQVLSKWFLTEYKHGAYFTLIEMGDNYCIFAEVDNHRHYFKAYNSGRVIFQCPRSDYEQFTLIKNDIEDKIEELRGTKRHYAKSLKQFQKDLNKGVK